MSERDEQIDPLRKLGKGALIIACWLVVWQIVALVVDNAWLLCGPLETLESWIELAATGTFWFAIASSLGRIALGFVVAFAAGILMGYLAGKIPLLGDIIEPVVLVVKSAPVVCIIALLLVGTGASAATSIVVGLVVFPQFYHAVVEAVRSRDEKLDEVLRIFGVPNARKALYVEFVALGTSIRAACSTAAGLAWKSGVAAELIGLPALSIGTGVYLAKLSLDSATIIAWTATVILLSWLSEKLLLWLIDLLLRLPKRMLSRRVNRALATTSAEDATMTEQLPACAIEIDEIVRRFANDSDGDEGASTTLIYKCVNVPAGSRLCIMAPSGAGKTTLLHLIAGIEAADTGGVSFGAPASENDDARPHMSVMLQDCTLLEWATPLENVALVAQNDAEIRHARNELLQILDEGDLSKSTSALSGGMRRRVELCRALAHPGQLMIADEPFSGLDDATKKHCIQLIDQAIDGRTLLVATHDEKDAELLGARVIHL